MKKVPKKWKKSEKKWKKKFREKYFPCFPENPKNGQNPDLQGNREYFGGEIWKKVEKVRFSGGKKSADFGKKWDRKSDKNPEKSGKK